MTLDFKKYIRNSVRKQMKIQHFDCRTQVFKREELPEHVVDKIQGDLGDNAVLDGDYFLFFTGQGLTRDLAKTTLFKIANSALGNAANNMVPEELKMLELHAVARPVPEKTSDEVDTLDDDSGDDANAEAVSDAIEDDQDLEESVEEPEAGEKFVYLKITMK